MGYHWAGRGSQGWLTFLSISAQASAGEGMDWGRERKRTRGKEPGSCLGNCWDSSIKGKEALGAGPQAFMNRSLQIPAPMDLFILARESP